MHVRKGFKESTQYFWHREQHVQSWRASSLRKMARVAGREGERDRVTAEGETGGEDTGQPVQGLGEGVRKSF